MSLWRFRGGIHLAGHKKESSGEALRVAALPPQLILPLRQSAGTAAEPLVQVGDEVLGGQMLARPGGPISAAVHAPTSGRIVAIEPLAVPHPSGLSAPCIVLEADGFDHWLEATPVEDPLALPADEVGRLLREAGLVGLGGAVFPSHAKLRKPVGTLILNGAECEPWITCDDALMRSEPAAILDGAHLLAHALGARRILIGVEDNKPEAIAALRRALADFALPPAMTIAVEVLPTRYPTGGERQLMRVLTGIEVPYGQLGPDYGVQVFNVGTAHAAHRALRLGRPLTERLVTLTGNVERPGNVRVRLGTPMRELLALAGVKPDTDRVLMGGPMMGFALPDLGVPVVKASNCLLAASPSLFPPPPPELPCIRCGRCARACPMDLQPFELYWFARARLLGKAQEYHLFDCIECGCCAYVCPAHIRLVDYYRYAKGEIRARERDKQAADQARQRYEFRLFREEREKAEKAARLAAKAAETRARLAAEGAGEGGGEGNAGPAAAGPAGDEAKKALIAAALARAQAQKAASEPANTANLTSGQQAQIEAIEARRAEIERKEPKRGD